MRTDLGTGWSKGWKINWCARLKRWRPCLQIDQKFAQLCRCH
ncbi:hypothetical protein ACFSSE_06110 [Pedobacter alpinus]|uniref:Uncharacterized protein n=1 Tax=Pedobacter alpinus TaxID=1590643 RepID=A0ABW5TR78_9SPHI